MGLSPGVLSPMPPPEEADMADAAAVVLERPVASRFDAAAAQDAGLDTSASAEHFVREAGAAAPHGAAIAAALPAADDPNAVVQPLLAPAPAQAAATPAVSKCRASSQFSQREVPGFHIELGSADRL